jgi:hypothetical protein
MDLVTLFMACTVSLGTPGGSPCSGHPRLLRHVIVVAETDPGTTKSPVMTTITASAIDRWQPFIVEAANRFGIPETWIRTVMAAESGGQAVLDGRLITSFAGAMGLMQVMPETYAQMRFRHGLGADPYDPHDNILAGVAFLRAMYDRYGYPGFFAAYNAGPARLDDYLLRGISLPDETLHYLLSISPDLYDAVVAERPDATTRLVAGNPRTVTPPSGRTLFFALGRASIASLPSSLSAVDGQVLSPNSNASGPLSGTLFVPLAGASRAAGDRP